MRTQAKLIRVAAIAAVLASLIVSVVPTTAAPIGDDAFWRTWARTDKPVQDGTTTRTWMWGPEAYTDVMPEKYADTPGGTRSVQYFDKSRMEITNPGGDPNSEWYVSNGLLARELITGEMQVGDSVWEERAPATVNVAGDPGDTSATSPTYASFYHSTMERPREVGSLVTRQITRTGGQVSNPDPVFATYGVTHEVLISETNHTVASVFWDFLHETGEIYDDGATSSGPLFDPWFYATGYPITEPFWARVEVGGTPKDVLAQCFERRCLTYTPSNPAQWQVEMGNVGQHYYRWRYEQWTGDLPATGTTLYESSLEDWAVYPGTEWVDGALQFTVEPGANPGAGVYSGGAFWTDQPGGFADISVSIDIRAVAPTPTDRSRPAETCLFVRGNPGQPQHAYSLCIDQSGRYLAYFWSMDPNETPELLAERRYFARGDAFSWHRLTIVSKGTALWFLVDGEMFATAVHDTYTTGQVGFSVTNASTGTVAWQFRNLEVQSLQ
jgi:hypothetical protein